MSSSDENIFETIIDLNEEFLESYELKKNETFVIDRVNNKVQILYGEEDSEFDSNEEIDEMNYEEIIFELNFALRSYAEEMSLPIYNTRNTYEKLNNFLNGKTLSVSKKIEF